MLARTNKAKHSYNGEPPTLDNGERKQRTVEKPVLTKADSLKSDYGMMKINQSWSERRIHHANMTPNIVITGCTLDNG